MAETSIDPGASKVFIDDWSADLSAATKALGLGTPLTISSATVVASNSATVTQVTPVTTGVIFKLAVAGVSNPPTNIIVTVTPTLNNGDVDVRHHTIQVTST